MSMAVPGICRSRGCTITATYDMATMRHIVQHGENPEHVMFINDGDLMALSRPPEMTWESVWWCHVTSKLIRWANEIHRYQEAARQPATAPGGADGRDGGEG